MNRDILTALTQLISVGNLDWEPRFMVAGCAAARYNPDNDVG
jgi:hypothetical protein